jgi:hypothetical protein
MCRACGRAPCRKAIALAIFEADDILKVFDASREPVDAVYLFSKRIVVQSSLRGRGVGNADAVSRPRERHGGVR